MFKGRNLREKRQIKSSTDPKLKSIISAVNKKFKLDIFYKDNYGNEKFRTIQPSKVYEADNNQIYVYAFCQNAGDFRTFKLNNINFEQIKNSNLEKKNITVNKKSNSKKSESNKISNYSFETKYGDIVSRPICIVENCENLVQLKEYRNKKPYFRKKCTTCSKKK